MAEASRPETTSSSSKQVMLPSGHVDLFDFVLIHDVVDWVLGYDDQLRDGVSAAAAAPASQGELEVGPGNTSIVAKGLIDPADGWYFHGWADREPVSWVLPGPGDGPFAAFDRRAFLDREWPTPERVPVLIKLVPDDDAEVRDFMEDARQDSGAENLTDCVRGWVELRDSRWHGKVHDAFPNLVGPEAVASLDRPGHHVHLDDRRDQGGILLPFVLELKERSRLSLNADALDRMVVVLPSRQYQTLRDQIAGAGSPPTGLWWGKLAFRRDGTPVVSETRTLQLHAGGPGETVERLRADWELGIVFREARESWQHRLPPVRYWQRSRLHTALRRMLPGLAAEGRAEDWTDRQRTETMGEVLSIALECRFADSKSRVFGENEILEKASAAVGADKDLTREFWSLYELGVGKIDPWSYHLLKGPSADEFVDLARRYERIPGMWSPAVSRALLHGLLLAETSAYLEDTSNISGIDLSGVMLYDERGFVDGEQRNQLRQLQDRQKARAARRTIPKWIVLSLHATALGGWIGGLKGAILGLLIGGWAADYLLQKSAAATYQTPERERSRKMQLAVLSVSHPTVSWEEARRRMREAAEAGAAWAPEAWRLVEQACRREVASRTD